ncbi:hypothetical protein E4U16_001090, partial [Claviceps sp. LM84 group G4]
MPPRKSSDAAPLPARTRLVDKAPSASTEGLPASSGSSGTGGSKEGREKEKEKEKEREREYVTIE